MTRPHGYGRLYEGIPTYNRKIRWGQDCIRIHNDGYIKISSGILVSLNNVVSHNDLGRIRDSKNVEEIREILSDSISQDRTTSAVKAHFSICCNAPKWDMMAVLHYIAVVHLHPYNY